MASHSSMPPWIGKYQVQEELGRGAFGRVFHAFDPTMQPGRHVAIKVLGTENDADLLGRFRSEAGTTGSLKHKNIVTVYDYGQHEGLPYLVMEFLEGRNLQQVIKQEGSGGKATLSILDKVRIMFQVAEGLHYAHQSGVIHRDIKPANIMLLPNGTVKIMDFGIARFTNREATRRTRQGDMVGTILYMAPEQVLGHDADQQSDIFAYGVVYYELLSGIHPFHANDAGSAIYRITSVEPSPVGGIVPACPPGLDAIVSRCMAKTRAMRFESLEDVLLDTQPLLLALRQARSTELMLEVPPLISGGDWATAQAKIREALELNPMNVEGRYLRETIKQEQQRQAVRSKIEELIQEGDAHSAQRRFQEAIQVYQSALQLDTSSELVQSRLNQAQERLDAGRRATRLLAEARWELQQGDWTAASRHVAESIRADPELEDAKSFQEQLERQQARRQMEMLREVGSRRDQGDFGGALVLLANIEKSWPGLVEASALRTQIESRAEKLRKGMEQAQNAQTGGQFTEALNILRGLTAEFPEQIGPPKLLAEVQNQLAAERTRKVNQVIQTAEELRRSGRLREAQSVLAEFAGVPEVQGLERQLELDVVREESEKRLQKLLADARLLLKGGNIDDAVTLLGEARQTFGDRPELSTLISEAKGAALDRDRERNFRQAIHRVKGLLVAEAFDEALQLLAVLAAENAGSAEVESLIQQAKRQKGEKERLERLQTGIAAARRTIHKRDWHEAVGALENLQREFPGEQEIHGLLTFASDEMAAEEHARKVEQIAQQASRLAEKLDFEGALKILEQALETNRGEESLRRLILSVKADQERHRVLQERVADCRRMRDNGATGDALALATILAREFAAVPEVIALRDELQREARAKEERGRAAERESASRRDIEWLLEQTAKREELGDWDGALQLIGEGLLRHRDSPELQAAAERLGRRRGEAESLRRAALACAEVERLLTDERLDAAQERLARARRDCRADARFDALATKLKDAQFRQQQLAVAREHLRNRRYDPAERILKEALARDENDFAARDMLATLVQQRSLEQQKQKVEAARAEGRRLTRDRQFDAAIRVLEELRAEYPDDPLLIDDLNITRAAKDRVVLHESVARGRLQAEEALRAKDFTGAIRLLQDLQKTFPDDTAVAEDLRTAIGLKEGHERKHAHALGRAEAEGMLAERNFSGAIKRYEALLKQFPKDAVIQEDLQSATRAKERHERKEESDSGRAEAQRLLRDKQFDRAIAKLEALSAKFPEDITVSDNLQAAKAAKAEAQAFEFYLNGRAEAERLTAARAFEEAMRKYEALLKRFPDDGTLQTGLDSVKTAKAAEERRQTFVRERAEAEELSRQRNFDAALRKLKKLREQFGQDPALEKDIESVLSAKKLQEERLKIDDQIAQLEKLYRKGDARTVQEKATRLLAEIEEPRARELLNWAGASLLHESQVRPVGPPAARAPGRLSKRTWLWIAAFASAVALGTVVLAVITVVGYLRFSVTPEEIRFAWKPGTAAPESRKVFVKTANQWTFSTNDEWLAVTPAATNPRSELTISVVPASLSPGSHTGVVEISAGPVTKTVRVRLNVVAVKIEAQQSPPPPTLDVRPQDPIQFVWKQGTPLPEQKVFVIATGSASQWRASTSAQWLVLKPRGNPLSELAISIATNLPLGRYSDQIAITGGPVKRSIDVTLTVEPPDSKPPEKPPPQPPPPARVEEPPITDKEVNCNSPSYNGLDAGKLFWSGDLSPNETLTLGRTRATVKPPGAPAWKGDPLPGCDVEVTPSPNVTLEILPNPSNRFSRLQLKNSSGATLRSITLSWKVKR